MRSIFYTLIIIFICSTTLISAGIYKTGDSGGLLEFIKPKPRITIYFGKNRPTCQSKFNICYMNFLVREYLPGDYEAIGTFGVGQDGRSLIFNTEWKTGFTNHTYNECFADGNFIMTVDFIIPDDIVFETGFRGDPIIRSGSYPVIERGGMITILFIS